MQDCKKILEEYFKGHSQRSIALTLNVSRNTVKKVIDALSDVSVPASDLMQLSSKDLYTLLFGTDESKDYLQPDYILINQELAKPGVTLYKLWQEYCYGARRSGRKYYQKTQFFDKYHQYMEKKNYTKHLNHKPGHRMMVDWAGDTYKVMDAFSGKEVTAYLFVATLPYSMYTYVEACPDMKSDTFINAHIHAFEYFQGTAALLIPDNLKTGVTENKKWADTVVNKAYEEMAEHFGISIVPTRVRKPKDKAAVEGMVKVACNFIFGILRQQRFFSFEELNHEIQKLTDQLNQKPFQKREGSRFSVYTEEEKPFMRPLPTAVFEPAEWKTLTVHSNYHVTADHQNYSCPYTFIKEKVMVKITAKKVIIYHDGVMIAEHGRLYGRKNQYSTQIDHMPAEHQESEWDAKRFKDWARSIGRFTLEVVEGMLDRVKTEEQAYKGCHSLLKLSKQYGNVRLEKACEMSFSKYSYPSFGNVRNILKNKEDLAEMRKQTIKNKSEKEEINHIMTGACLRGEDYYG